MLILPFPFPVPITSTLPGGRTVSAAQAAHQKSTFHPRSAPPALNSQWHGSRGVPLHVGEFPEPVTTWGSLEKTVQAGSEIHSSPKRGRVVSGVLSKIVIAKVLFLKLPQCPSSAEMESLLHRNLYSCLLLILSIWFYILPGLLLWVGVCAHAYLAQEVYAEFYSQRGTKSCPHKAHSLPFAYISIYHIYSTETYSVIFFFKFWTV